MKHPWDPHAPSYSGLIPHCLRPYPSFEGWYFRITDPSMVASFAVIIATNYATEESIATIIFCVQDEDQDAVTHCVHTMSKDASIITLYPASDNIEGKEPFGFEWVAPDIGKVVAKSYETNIDITVNGYHLKAVLTSEVHWNSRSTVDGPEGCLRFLPLPTNWYIYSIGSTASYEFADNTGVRFISKGWAHEEKNWGLTFPHGHIWMEGITKENAARVVVASGYYSLGTIIRTSYVSALGFWAPGYRIIMTTAQLGTLFTDIKIDPDTRTVFLKAINPKFTIEVTASAPISSFSEPVLAPVGRLEWKAACKESFVAEINVKLFAHNIWGIPCRKKLVASLTFEHAALEFGEDLLK